MIKFHQGLVFLKIPQLLLIVLAGESFGILRKHFLCIGSHFGISLIIREFLLAFLKVFMQFSQNFHLKKFLILGQDFLNLLILLSYFKKILCLIIMMVRIQRY